MSDTTDDEMDTIGFGVDLSPAVSDIFRRAEAELGGRLFEFGPGHIVFADENLEDDSIRFCLDACDDVREYRDRGLDTSKLLRVRAYLEELLAIPEADRCTPRAFEVHEADE